MNGHLWSSAARLVALVSLLGAACAPATSPPAAATQPPAANPAPAGNAPAATAAPAAKPAGGGATGTVSVAMVGNPQMPAKYTAVDHVDHHTPYFAGDNFIGSTKVFWSTWYVHKSKTGLLGDPTHATPEAGKVLIEACLKHLVAFITDYVTISEPGLR